MAVPPFSAPWKFTGHPFLATDLPSSWPGAPVFFRAAATAGRDMFDEHHKPQRPASILSLVVSFIDDVDDDDATDVGASRPVKGRKGSGRRKGVGPSKRKEKFQLANDLFQEIYPIGSGRRAYLFSLSFLLKNMDEARWKKRSWKPVQIDRFNVAEAPRCSLGEADGAQADGDEATGANCPFLH
jgi:hypothetical protein